MNQISKRQKRYGPRRIRTLPQGLREKLNRLILHGFSPLMCKKIMHCLYGSKISVVTIERHRKYLYAQVNESFKDFKARGEELKHGRGGYLPPEWLDLFQPPSEYPTETSKIMREKKTVEEKVVHAKLETEDNQRKVKVLIGKPL